EVIRLILEGIYDSPHGPYFHETSHGFRPDRSCHTALREIRGKWPALNWVLEGDIQACFDAIDHSVLVSLLRKKIRDERFPNFIRIKYLRYADDWLIGICGPRTLAEQIKEELKLFLGQDLKLTLSEEKTQITHAREEQAHFLGTRLAIGREGVQRVVTTNNGSKRPIRRRSTGSEIVMTAPKSDLIKKLHVKGFCTPEGQPTTKLGWIHLDADQIVVLYSGINRGIQNYYRFADNFGHLAHIQYILKSSLAKTLAAKYKRSVNQIFRRFGKVPTLIVKAKGGRRDRQIAFYSNSDWKKQRNGFQVGQTIV